MKLNLKCKVCLAQRAKSEAQIRLENPTLAQTIIDALPSVKDVTIVSEFSLHESLLVKYSCGHSVLESKVKIDALKDDAEKNERRFTSLTKNYTAYEYQKDFVTFARETNFNCLLADEMALGKTVQVLLAFREVIASLSPTVIVIPSSTIFQWVNQFKEWATLDNLGIQPILSSKNPILPIFNTYLVSMDLLPDVVDKLIALRPKLVIADEVQSFKNPSAKRSQALVKLIQQGKVEHKIFLSGTPIKNRAGEYFTVLNLLAPGHFPSFKKFVTQWLEPELTKSGATVYRRLRRTSVEYFRQLTSRWILRRETKDVQKDLPPIRYSYQDIFITDPELKKAYNAKLDLYANFLRDPREKKNNVALLGWLAQIRHETALAKRTEVEERARQFLTGTEENGAATTKLAIGIHHKDVREMLKYGLNEFGSLSLSGEDSAQQKQLIKEQFQRIENRVLVMNMLSGGVGMDGLQICSNVFIVETPWSPADEEQFIKRFNRDRTQLINDGIMSTEESQTPTLVTYLMAHGTIDTFMQEQKEDKKKILGDAYGSWDLSTDTESLMQLSERIINNRL